VGCLKVPFDAVGNSSPSAFCFEHQVVHWTCLWSVATFGFVFADRAVRETAFAPVLTVTARKIHLQRQVLQSDVSSFQES
jgi:hypothetical protein